MLKVEQLARGNFCVILSDFCYAISEHVFYPDWYNTNYEHTFVMREGKHFRY